MRLRLSNGGFTQIDAEDYERAVKLKWFRWTSGRNVKRSYAVTATYVERKKGTILLHRFIMRARSGQVVDHINGDGLDNRKQNLRFATHSQNSLNRHHAPRNKHGVFGIYHAPEFYRAWNGVHYRRKRRWIARITLDKRVKTLGSFLTKREAIAARRAAEREFLP